MKKAYPQTYFQKGKTKINEFVWKRQKRELACRRWSFKRPCAWLAIIERFPDYRSGHLIWQEIDIRDRCWISPNQRIHRNKSTLHDRMGTRTKPKPRN